MSESLSHDLREAWRQLRAKNPAMAALCLESAGALEKAEAEVRRLRREAIDVFECADGTVAKDASVAAQSWADECRRLREEVATLTDQRDEARQLATQWSNEGGAEIARLHEREAKAREILQAHADEYERTDTDDGVLRAAERLGIWMASKRWLETE